MAEHVSLDTQAGVPLSTGPGAVSMPTTMPQGQGDGTREVTLEVPQAQPQVQEAPPAESGVEYVDLGGKVGKVPIGEVMDWRDSGLRQADYTRKTQELADLRRQLEPAQELYDYLSQNPDVAQKVVDVVYGNDPQAQGQPTQAQAPMMDPRLQQGMRSMYDEMADLRFQLEEMQFKGAHPDTEIQEVAQYAVDNQIPSLEQAFRAMSYDRATKDAQQQIVDNAQQAQAAHVEHAGTSQPPGKVTLDISNMTTQDIFREASKYYPLTK
jgi:hypothetical protein